MRWLAVSLALVLASSANAAPPPPPPEYVYDAGKALATPASDAAKAAPLFADDVVVFRNGTMIATGKDAWLKILVAIMENRSRRVIGYSEGAGLLVVDTYDTVDRTNIPSTFVVDPRMATRSVLYEFGTDHLIHSVRVDVVEGFWIARRN